MAVFPDGVRLASVGDDGTLRIWDLRNRELVRTIALCDEGLSSVAISPNGRYVVAGSTDAYFYNMRMKGTVAPTNGQFPLAERSTVAYLCDLEAGCRITEVFHGSASVKSLAFSADGLHLAVGTRYDEVCLVTLDGKVLARIPCGAKVESLEFIRDSSQLLLPNRKPISRGNYAEVAQLWRDDLSALETEFDYTLENIMPGITVARSLPGGQHVVVGERYKGERI